MQFQATQGLLFLVLNHRGRPLPLSGNIVTENHVFLLLCMLSMFSVPNPEAEFAARIF